MALSMDKRRVSKYCVVLISDYVAVVAALDGIAGSGGVANATTKGSRMTPRTTEGPTVTAAAGSDVWKATLSALRRGAFCLLSSMSQSELQHLHTVMGMSGQVSHLEIGGRAGGSAVGAAGLRAALLALRMDYETHYKFEGKV